MSLERATGFEYNTLLEVDSYYYVVGPGTGFPRTGTYSFAVFGAGFVGFRLTARDEYYFQIPGRNNLLIEEGRQIISWRKAGITLGGVKIGTGGVLQAYTGNFATLVGTGTNALAQSEYNLVQVRVKIADSGGIIQVKLEANTEIDFSGDTKPGNETTIDELVLKSYYGQNFAGAQTYFDDIVINNTLGPQNNSWPNGIPIYVIRPSAAGYYSQWTPSTGDNYACVDEIPPSLTDYVRPTASGQKDTYNFPDCPEEVSQVSFVAADYFGEVRGSPVTQFKRLMRINSTDYEGSARPLDILNHYQEVVEVNPADSQPWEPADINGLELGMTSVI